MTAAGGKIADQLTERDALFRTALSQTLAHMKIMHINILSSTFSVWSPFKHIALGTLLYEE